MAFSADDYLAHHGILGMKWGKRNGPPYPLGAGDHSASEKKAGWRKSLDGESKKSSSGSSSTKSESEKKEFHLTDEQKRAIKIGAVAAGVALAAVGTVYLAKSGKLDNLVAIGKNAIGDRGAGGIEVTPEIKKAFGTITDKSADTNVRLVNDVGGGLNCGATSSGLLLRVNQGLNVTAKNRGLTTWSELEAIWPGAKHQTMMPCDTHTEIADILAKKFSEGDNGILRLNSSDTSKAPDHYINWFIENGKTVFRDAQPEYAGGHGWPPFDGNAKFAPFFAAYNLDICEYMQVNNIQPTSDLSVLKQFFNIR